MRGKQHWRSLPPDTKVPEGTPRRHRTGRYIELVWVESPLHYVRALEHRVHNGRTLPADVHVHHRDHDTTNNDPANLEFMTDGEHRFHHRKIDHDEVLRLTKEGLTRKEIGLRLGCNRSSISRILIREFGFQSRQHP